MSSIRGWLLPIVMASLLACGDSQRRDANTTVVNKPDEQAKPEPKADPPQTLDLSSLPPYDPAKVTPLEVLYFPEPVGEGYAKTTVKFGPSLYSAKHLILGNGDAEFITPTRIIVNEIRAPKPNVFLAEITKSVLLDVETGEQLVEFEGGRYRQWDFGLGLVFVAGDERPYLLDAELGTLVLAVPEGEHLYRLDVNYFIRFSPIAKRVWIYATDHEGVVHLYEWEDRSKPPPLPDNPFPFFPEDWDPQRSTHGSDADTEEVSGQRNSTCNRAILVPPRSWECLDDVGLEKTEPLSEGWRYAQEENAIFNRDGRGFIISSLCSDQEQVFGQVLSRAPARLRITCMDDPSLYYEWTPPDNVSKIAPEYARWVDGAEAYLSYYESIHAYEISRYDIAADTDSIFDTDSRTRELIGPTSTCDNPIVRGTPTIHGTVCRKRTGEYEWTELVDRPHEKHAQFIASELALSDVGHAVAIVRRDQQDHVVSVSLR